MLYDSYNIYLTLLSECLVNNDIEMAKFWQAVARKYKSMILKTPIKKLIEMEQNNVDNIFIYYN